MASQQSDSQEEQGEPKGQRDGLSVSGLLKGLEA